jgi:hypothetical protein
MEITYRHTHVGTIEFAPDNSTASPYVQKGFDVVTLGIPALTSESWKRFGNDWLSSPWNYIRRKHD